MLPPGYLRSLYSFKGIRIKVRRKLIGNSEKKIYIRGRKDRTIDRSMKRGEKHQFKLQLRLFI